MATFDEREKAFEKRFVHDQEFAFRAEARRNRDVARWVAGLIGRKGTEVEAYAAEIVQTGMGGGGRQAVLDRLWCDLDAAGVPAAEYQLEQKMETLLVEALRALKQG